MNGFLGLVHALVLQESVALDVARPSVDIEDAVLDLTILAERVLQVLFLELLMQAGYYDHVALDTL